MLKTRTANGSKKVVQSRPTTMALAHFLPALPRPVVRQSSKAVVFARADGRCLCIDSAAPKLASLGQLTSGVAHDS